MISARVEIVEWLIPEPTRVIRGHMTIDGFSLWTVQVSLDKTTISFAADQPSPMVSDYIYDLRYGPKTIARFKFLEYL